MAGHVARRTGAECAVGSIGRPTAMTVAEAVTHRGVVVAITRHGTVAVVHRRIVAMSFGRIGSVEVVSGIVACAPAAVASSVLTARPDSCSF